jgi:signal transduction histidine kinase/DNA-binding response OmpR family regulator
MSTHLDVGSLPLETWLTGGGELGQLIRERDWSSTPLGPLHSWPQSLKTTLGILLHSRYPMFVFWGPQLIKIYNDAYRPITGHKHPWALGRPGPEVWPEIWSDIKPLVDRALAGDSTWSDDLMLFMERNGFPEEVYFTFSYSPISDESGGVGGMFCACTETTGKVLGERRLRTLRDLAAAPAEARTVAEACLQSVRVLEANVADVPFALVYLAEGDGLLRLRAHAGVVPGTPLAPLEVAASQAEVWALGVAAATRVAEHVTPLAERFENVPAGPWPEPPSAAMVLPLVDRGLERGVGALVLGISARRPFDADYREWFGLVAAQMSASISNARAAEEERKRAEALAELDRAKTTFFSNVSHEFRTPLTLLLGPIEDALSSRVALGGETLATLHRNAQRLLKLVNSLLDFSRLEAGRAILSAQPTDLGTMTADLASVFRSAIEKAGLTFTVDCPPLDVMVDRDMWEKVVLNLISNAFKHTFAGEIAVTLRRAGGDRAELCVKDTGVGIAHEELPHLFERFHRVKEARARTHEGAGIGLALVHELVALHGGEVSVDSQPGHGSTFTVSIPLVRAHSAADAGTLPRAPVAPATAATEYVAEAVRWLPPEPAQEGRRHSLPGNAAAHPAAVASARVVIADDNADMRDYVRRLLEPHWRVETVADGEAALATMRREAADLLLSDVMMPALDGFGLLQALRQDAALQDTPVILLSARAGEEARVEGLQAGADDYLVKPFGARELIARVSAALELSRVRREAQQRLSDVNRDLRHRVAELETLLSVIPVGIGIALDRECRSIHVNPAFAAALGVPLDANASLTAPAGERPTTFRVRDVDGNEVPPEQLPMQVAAREGREVREIELDVERDDGHRVRLLEYAVPLFDEKNEPRGSIGAFVDISERKKIEDHLQRTNRLKDEFLATLSHELRTPLNAVLGWTHMIRTGTLPKDVQARAFDSLERNARAQAQLVDDLLDVSRIVSGKLQIARDRVDLRDVLTLALETIQPTAINKGVKLKFVARGRTPAIVTGDADRLRQVAWNLLSNAVKFTPRGGHVRVELTSDRSHAEIVVRDTGQGIDPDFLPFVFDRFRQADGTAARRHGGLGLGLAIVRHLTEAHGGTATAASEGLSRGAVFRLRLPLAAALGVRSRKTHSSRRAAALLERSRILVVDDEEDARDLLRAVLEGEGAAVETAKSAGEALHRLQRERFDLLLADIAMPDQDGIALIRALRGLSGEPRDIPAIAVTAYASLREREVALESGYGWHLPKPVEAEQLIAAVAAAIRQSRPTSSRRRPVRTSATPFQPKRRGKRTSR